MKTDPVLKDCQDCFKIPIAPLEQTHKMLQEMEDDCIIVKEKRCTP